MSWWWQPTEAAQQLSGAGGAALAGVVTATSATAGALTTGIPLAGAVAGASTGAAALTTGIPLAASTTAQSAAQASLTTGNPLVGTVTAAASADAALTTGIPLVGVVAAGASTVGALTTSIVLAGSSAGASTTAGVLTTSIVLVGSTAGISALTGTLAAGAAAALAGVISAIAVVVGALAVTPPKGLTGSVTYVVEILDSGATFGPGTKLGELWDLRNLGWSAYDRIPGKAFFTLSQRSDMLSLITPLTTHIRIWRLTPNLTTLVYVGAIIDYDSTGDDVVFSAFDYKALLSISRTGYRTLYPTKAIGSEIVSPEWVLAKGATSSPLGFVTTGTIEDPLGTDESTVIKTNNQFGLLDQMRLQLFFDLSEIGRANTIHHTTFEITRSATPTFEFRKNRGVNVDMGLVLNGNVADYRHLPNWTSYRNDLATIGVTVGGGATEVVVKDDTAAAARGRRQDVFTIKTLLGVASAATTTAQQQIASERVLKSALQLQPTLQLKMIRGGVDFFNGWDLCDKPLVEIDNGVDSIAERWRILGARATFDESGESPSLIVGPVAA